MPLGGGYVAFPQELCRSTLNGRAKLAGQTKTYSRAPRQQRGRPPAAALSTVPLLVDVAQHNHMASIVLSVGARAGSRKREAGGSADADDQERSGQDLCPASFPAPHGERSRIGPCGRGGGSWNGRVGECRTPGSWRTNTRTFRFCFRSARSL